eukprot:gnl/TRDRNA2_/TRDRNA2_184823_c0_seq1.p1 gnl/TRDRNA2_/TRDRNA2_184823_c0~~gnl/TRDRNA2_/TRDRNA2_184823_c0_seq1.p1  ORF type:complete len:283 (-),score=38.57 gnl/TRDRNA2_/TRDRNA2_184823_c0_seq1:107-955(-)
MPYGLRTLDENWFEDRLQPPGALTGCGDLSKKVPRVVESDLANLTGDRYDMLTRIARVPAKVSYGLPNDGFNENVRLSAVDFCHPASRKEYVRNPPERARLINTETVPEVCYEDRRPVPGKPRGFGAVLQRHEDSHGQRNWNTTSGDAFGGGAFARSLRGTRSDPALLRSSGQASKDIESRVEGMKVGKLVGEYMPDDPAGEQYRMSQRTWSYDPAMRNLGYGGTRPVIPKVDNHLSIPIGEGAMSKIRQDLEERKGKLFRVATTITKGKGERYGETYFQDY